MKELTKYLKQYPNAKILDLGSGQGDFIKFIDFLNQDYQEIIGIDIVDYLSEMDKSAFDKNPKIKWMDLDVLETTFPKNSFDIISLSNTLHHITDIESVFKQMAELLKPNGMIVVAELMSTNQITEGQLSHKLLHSFAAKVDRELNKVHAQVFTQENILKAIKKSSPLPIEIYWQLESENFDQEITLEELYLLIDNLLNNVKKSPNYDLYKEEARNIKEYLKKHGFNFGTTLCVILKN